MLVRVENAFGGNELQNAHLFGNFPPVRQGTISKFAFGFRQAEVQADFALGCASHEELK